MCRRIPIFQVQSKHIMLNDYYALRNGETTGPFSHTELMEQGMDPGTQIFSPLTNAWQEASELPEFENYFESIGILVPTQANVASFWWRLLAYFIDQAIYFVVALAFGAVIGLIILYSGIHFEYPDINPSGQKLLFRLLEFCLLALYNAAFEATKLQGSIGKAVCKLKVVDGMGRRITFPNALGRNFGKFLSSILCGMGFLNIFWNPRRQAWHDELAKTFVIRKP